MNSKQFQILKTIYYSTLEFKFCQLKASTFKQGKKFYQRVKELEQAGLIIVVRERGEPSLYRITDTGLNFVLSNITTTQIFQPA
jgi:predicted transcriptional regulator